MPNRRHLTVVGEIENGKPTKLAHGSTPPIHTDRMQSACVRACDAYRTVTRKAERIQEELDEVTSPHGVPTTELHDEDSVVIAVREAKANLAKD